MKKNKKNTELNEKSIQAILKSGLDLLEKIQSMNPNSSKYSLISEMCEAEFRDVLNLDPNNLTAMHALSELFYEYFNESASEEALDILTKAIKIDSKNSVTEQWIKKHKELLKEMRED